MCSLRLVAALVACLALGQADPILHPRATSAAACTPTLKPTPPAKLHCGQALTLKRPALITTTEYDDTTTPAVTLCYNACTGTKGCVSFSVDATTQTCNLYSLTVNKMGFKKNSAAPVFYNKRCFGCPPPSPPASSCISIALSTPTAITPYDTESMTATETTPETNEQFPVQLPFSIALGTAAESDFSYVYTTGVYAFDPNAVFTYAPFLKNFFDLEYIQGQDQGVFYEASGDAPNRIITFEWRLTNAGTSSDGAAAGTGTYHFFSQSFENSTDCVFAYKTITLLHSGLVYTYNSTVGSNNYYTNTDDGNIGVYNGLILQGGMDSKPWVVSQSLLCDASP